MRSKYHYKSLLENQNILDSPDLSNWTSDDEDSAKSDSTGFGEDTFEVCEYTSLLITSESLK